MADDWGPRYGWRIRLGGLAWRLSEVTSKNESSEQRLARMNQVLDRHVRHFGADSYPATMCRIDMARTLEHVNRTEEAAGLRRLTVAAFRSHRGHSDTRTLGEGVHLVNDLYLAGHHDEAVTIAQGLRQDGMQSHGSDHEAIHWLDTFLARTASGLGPGPVTHISSSAGGVGGHSATAPTRTARITHNKEPSSGSEPTES
jgi:hypothetical protein